MGASARLGAALAAGLAAAACARPTPPPPAPLPGLSVTQVTPAPTTRALPPLPPPRDDALPSGPPVSLSAVSVDVRALIATLAEALGASIVLGPEVQGRVSVNLVEVPADEALRVVLAEAGLTVVGGPPAPPAAPTVFYVLPVDVDAAGVELIMSRFGVGREVAEFIVRRQTPR